jgi:hypothetical protein
MWSMAAYSVLRLVKGDCPEWSLALGSIGLDTGLRPWKLKRRQVVIAVAVVCDLYTQQPMELSALR